MVEKESLICPKKTKLTTAEKGVLHLISDEFLGIKQIAKQRDCSIQAIYKIVKSLKQKGALDGGLNMVENIQSTFNQSDIRLHGQEFNIRIIWQDNKYQEEVEKANIQFIDSNSVRLYKNSIEIYSGQSFLGKTSQDAEKTSLEYWNRFLARLEHDLKIILIKPRARNIRIVNQHYARGDSEVCDNARSNKERVWIFAEEDGRLCYITDDSFGFREDETVHPTTAKLDRKAIDKQINDWRLNNPPTQSEIDSKLNKAAEILLNNQELLIKLPQAIGEFRHEIRSHLKLIREYRKENKVWRTALETKYKVELSKHQRRLDFYGN